MGDFVERKNVHFYSFVFFRIESEVLRRRSELLEKGSVARK